jgi:hypothetical protein
MLTRGRSDLDGGRANVAKARRLRTILAVVVATVFLTASPAVAEPKEGSNKALQDALEAASTGHVEAKNKLENSKKRQAELEEKRKQSESVLQNINGQIGDIANRSYRTGRATVFALVLSANSSDDFLAKMTQLDAMAQVDSRKLARHAKALQDVQDEKIAIDREVDEQAKQEFQMAKKVQDAEKALKKVGGGGKTGGFVSPNSPEAKPAPKNDDGSWPKESCNVEDPTPASGCITPRTLHALNEARANGFGRYASCHRSGGGGEHPKGRACDFAAAAGGFEDVNASGGDKQYGDNLAAFFVSNASRLGVMYVIWYRQVWMPGKGWSAYSGSGGPAETHTNHVHLSML